MNYRINPEVLKEVRIHAIENNLRTSQVMEEALRKYLFEKAYTEVFFERVAHKSQSYYILEFLIDGKIKEKVVPISQIKANTEKSITIPNWLAKEIKENN